MSGIFGWSYPPGCSGPPDEEYDDRTVDESADQELMDKCDPYGKGCFIVGSGDDVIYFDCAVDSARKRIAIASTLNSETGHFIQAFEPRGVYSFEDAPVEAARLTSMALDWLAENDVRHSTAGSGQDPACFFRYVKWLAGGSKGRRPGRNIRHWYRKFLEGIQ